MSDPHLNEAVELVDAIRSMSAAEASRYIFDRYRTASPSFREAIVLALVGALATAWQRASDRAYKHAALTAVTSVQGDHIGIAFATADGPVRLRIAIAELLLVAADLKALPKRTPLVDSEDRSPSFATHPHLFLVTAVLVCLPLLLAAFVFGPLLSTAIRGRTP